MDLELTASLVLLAAAAVILGPSAAAFARAVMGPSVPTRRFLALMRAVCAAALLTSAAATFLIAVSPEGRAALLVSFVALAVLAAALLLLSWSLFLFMERVVRREAK